MRRLAMMTIVLFALIASSCGAGGEDLAVDGRTSSGAGDTGAADGTGVSDPAATDGNGTVPTVPGSPEPTGTTSSDADRGGRTSSDGPLPSPVATGDGVAGDGASGPTESSADADGDRADAQGDAGTSGSPDASNPSGTAPTGPSTPSPTENQPPPTVSLAPSSVYFTTVPPGSPLPSGDECAALVRADPRPETHPANATSNATTGGPSVLIDGAEGFRDDRLAARIDGDFAGTTDEILRWVACKWGFDEDLTRARAWTESSWRIDTAGDETDDAAACDYLGLAAPCPQSYGLLQVKGTVHEGTHPYSFRSTAWGVDYAMAWQRACFEGAFTWLDDQGYTAGDVDGCVGAWYSGEWYDEGANRYLDDVAENLAARRWDD